MGMSYLIDTHILLWWLFNDPKLHTDCRGIIRNPDHRKLPYIAEENGEIVGFGELEVDGHIDCFYCHSKYQRKGIGLKLLNYLENTAKLQGIKRLYTEASITAKPFFQNQGFSVIREQQVERRGVWFKNYVMEKYI